MKKIILLLGCLSVAFAGELPNIAGHWQDENCQDNLKNCTLLISQQDSSLKVIHYLEFQNKPFVEEGIGSISSNGKVQWDVKVTYPIPGWATAGVHTFQLSQDQKKLSGSFLDSKGNKGKLNFVKTHPH